MWIIVIDSKYQYITNGGGTSYSKHIKFLYTYNISSFEKYET